MKGYNFCFSGDCGICSSCSPSTNVVVYPTPGEIYKVMTGKEFQEPPDEKKKDTWALYRKMLEYSDEYLTLKPIRNWSRVLHILKIFQKLKHRDLIQNDIIKSHVEFFKGCTEEGVVYGEKRCLKPTSATINDMIFMDEIDLNQVAGSVVLSGGGLFNLDIAKKQANLKNEDYEIYFEKFDTYLKELDEVLKSYGCSLENIDSKRLPSSFTVNGEKYTYSDDPRICCDDMECGTMLHCMFNWQRPNNYTGKKKPKHCQFYYSDIVSMIPMYTKEMKHELCILCIKDK